MKKLMLGVFAQTLICMLYFFPLCGQPQNKKNASTTTIIRTDCFKNTKNCNSAAAQTSCCQTDKIVKQLNKLEKNLALCCTSLKNEILALTPCKTSIPIGQADIPFVALEEGYYCLQEDVVFDGTLVTNPAVVGPIGIALNTTNAVLDLNNHTITYKGAQANGIATIGNSAHITIKNGTIIGPLTDQNTAAILLLTSNATVKNVRIINAAGLGSAAITIQGSLLPSASSPTETLTTLNDITIENCDLEGNNYGIELNSFTNSININGCTINNSIQMGITQPARKNVASNVFINDCTISNSGLNGIFTTFSQKQTGLLIIVKLATARSTG